MDDYSGILHTVTEEVYIKGKRVAVSKSVFITKDNQANTDKMLHTLDYDVRVAIFESIEKELQNGR